MLSFLVGNKNLQIIEIALTWRAASVGFHDLLGMGLTVITPRPSQQLFHIRVPALLFANHCNRLFGGSDEYRCAMLRWCRASKEFEIRVQLRRGQEETSAMSHMMYEADCKKLCKTFTPNHQHRPSFTI
jgi:hypothetical protein